MQAFLDEHLGGVNNKLNMKRAKDRQELMEVFVGDMKRGMMG